MRIDNSIQESDKRIVFRGEAEPSVAPIIEKALSKGWKSITLQGNIELCRSTWYEAKMAGLDVVGYKATREDNEMLKQMQLHKNKLAKNSFNAAEIAKDYNIRVLPVLQKRYDDLRRKRSKLGITVTDLDRAYGINLPTGYAKIVDEQFDHARVSLSRAKEDRDFFHSLGVKNVPVKFSYEDGIARFIVKDGRQKFIQREDMSGLSRRHI